MTSHRNNWRVTILLFAVTGVIESLAWGHLGAFTPLYLEELRVPHGQIAAWTGVMSALGFVIGLPLLPFWGVWAQRYGRKPIIIRSSVAGAVMFALAAASRDVWMLAATRFLGGLVLGNTGVMMAVQAEITPRQKLGSAVAIVSAGSPVGMTIGPFLGGQVIGAIGIRGLLILDSVLTVVIAAMLTLFLREEPRCAPPEGTREGIVAAFRVIRDTPAIFSVFVAVFLMNYGLNIAQPYLPLLLQRLYMGPASGLAPLIGLVLTYSGFAMAVGTPCWGPLGDRAGYLRMLQLCGVVLAVALAGQSLSTGVAGVRNWRIIQGLCQGGVNSLATVLLALHAPKRRRETVLTLSLLPAQVGWFIGPLSGSAVSLLGLGWTFRVGAVCMALGCVASARIPLSPPAVSDEVAP